jgi:hypothetical protein
VGLVDLPEKKEKEDMVKKELSRLDLGGETGGSFLNLEKRILPPYMQSWAFQDNSCHFDVFIETMYWIFQYTEVNSSRGMGPFLKDVSTNFNYFTFFYV